MTIVPFAFAFALVAGAGPADPLLAADRELDASVAARDGQAFRALLAPDAVFTGSSSLLQGRDAVWQRWSRFFEPEGPTLRWTPRAAGVATSGDLGWTVGDARYAWKAKGVAPRDSRYLTVWRKGPDGRWVVALDGTLEPVGPGGPSTRTAVRTLKSKDGKMEAAIGTFIRGKGKAGSTGAYLVVRERGEAGWRVAHESEIPMEPVR